MEKTTQYANVESFIGSLTSEKVTNYNLLAARLESTIGGTFKSLPTESNPVVTNLPYWELDDIGYLIKEYSGFTNESIHMFHDAAIRLKLKDVKAEIDRNVSEEMGSLTNGVPHLEMMRVGYKNELGIETEGVEYSPCTNSFLKKMTRIFRSSDGAYLCGALLAFEATATAEFKAVECIIKEFLKRLGQDELDPNSIIGRYIRGHVSDMPNQSLEDEHYNGLKQAIGRDTTPENYHNLTCGFLAVCSALNAWWEQLAIAVYAKKIDKLTMPQLRYSA